MFENIAQLFSGMSFGEKISVFALLFFVFGGMFIGKGNNGGGKSNNNNSTGQ